MSTTIADEDTSKEIWKYRAMEALFAFSEAMTGGKLSINDLKDIAERAIEDGSQLLHLQLLMAAQATTEEQV